MELRLGEQVTEVTPDAVWLQSGSAIPSFTVIWSAGVTGRALPGLPITRGNRVATAPELYVPEYPSIYVAGDINFLEYKDGRPHPQVAPTAMQQGALAAQNILRELRGQEQQVFLYKDKGSMATLGRSHAIAEIGNLKMRGFPAWGAWLAVHLYYLIGFRNRMMVLSNWAYSYFTYDFAVRIMHNRHSFPASNVSNEPTQEPVKA